MISARRWQGKTAYAVTGQAALTLIKPIGVLILVFRN